MTFRPATAADAAAISVIWNKSIRAAAITFTDVEKTPDELRLMMAGRQVFFVAEAGGIVIGFATYGTFRKGAGYRHTAELTIYLDARARGRGVGRNLLNALLDHALAQGIHVMVAGVSGANQPAIDFHMAMGFDVVGKLPEVGQKRGRWLDLVLLQKLLNT